MVQTIRVFLSSPGDVYAEREIARQIIEQLRHDPLIKDEIDLQIVAWDDPNSRTLMPVTLTPQQAIDRGLPKPSECDIVVVLFWGRMGTPLDTDRHGTKPNGDPYWSGTEWEYLDARRGLEESGAGLPLIYVYRRTDNPPVPDANDLDALENYITQRKRVENFFAGFTDSDTGAIKETYHEYDVPDTFKDLFSQDARLLVKEAYRLHSGSRAEADEMDAEAIEPTWDGSPFPGLRAFTEADEPIFFGRGRETADLLRKMQQQRFVAVVGASGSGKSSLVGAGIIPELRRKAIPVIRYVVRVTPGETPFVSLAESLIETVPGLYGDSVEFLERSQKLAANLRRNPENLSKTLSHALRDEPDGAEVLLFVDQFEEVFTLTPDDTREPLLAMLRQASDVVRFVVTLRADFYHRALPYLENELREGNFTLARPSQVALYEMIVRPASRAGLTLEDGLAERILHDTGDEPGALALVAYLLDELYSVADKRGDRRLTLQDYTDLGGVQKAIGTRAETAFAKLPGEPDEKEQTLRRIFRELIEIDERGEPTRRRMFLRSEERTEQERELIYAFASARLLTTNQTTDGAVMEVAHEALLREWTRLQDWIADIQDDLRFIRRIEREARLWDARGRPDFMRPSAGELSELAEALSTLGMSLKGEVFDDFLELEQERLFRELEDTETSHTRRLAIGEKLADIGDTRSGTGLRGDGLPDIAWCYVDVPENLRGQKITFKDDRGRIYAEREITPFYVAKYLVTYEQFQAFLEHPEGFEDDQWWQHLYEQYRKQEMSDQRVKFANNPRDSVSWYQAMAFAAWVDAMLPEEAYPEQARGAEWQTRLPLDWEWQWAAQNGREEREYPWGEWDERRCNTGEAGLNRPMAVGMYPPGAAVCGALDFCGQLQEWCWNTRVAKTESGSTSSRVLRGGASHRSPHLARCASRSDLSAYFRRDDYGLRLWRAVPVLPGK